MRPIDWTRPRPDMRPTGDFRPRNEYNAQLDNDPQGLAAYDPKDMDQACGACNGLRAVRDLDGVWRCRRCGRRV